jgi:ubiquinone/menaquinone biosynthesis C-methylase UbiE
LRSKKIFNSIAWIYDLTAANIRKTFTPSIRALVHEIDLGGKTVLDVGTGTGVWADMIRGCGAVVSGIDFSEKMLAKARKRYGGDICFMEADANNLADLGDDSFDIVTASFVLHGMTRDKREPVLLEMRRVSKGIVAIHDYDKGAPLFSLFLEWLEKSDYYNFTEHFYEEFCHFFIDCIKVPVSKGTALYIGGKPMGASLNNS